MHKILKTGIVSFALTLLFFIFAQNVSAADRYWVGSAGGNTNDTANWSTTQNTCGVGGGAGVPGSSDVARFTSSCTNGATIDANLNVGGVNISSGYSGTITQASTITITVGSSSYVQADGVFIGGNGTIDINNGAFTLSGGTFTATSSTLAVTRNFTITGGTFNHNDGTVAFKTFTGSSVATISCNNAVFNLVSFIHSNNWKTVSSNCTLPLGHSPTFSQEIRLSGTLTGSGTISGNTLTLNPGAVLSGFSGIMLTNNLNISGADLDAGGYSPFTILNFTLSSGSFTAPSATMSVSNNFAISGGAFNHNDGTVNFSGLGGPSASISCNNATFNAVTITHTANWRTVNSDCTLPLGDAPSISRELSLSGTLTGSGTITVGVQLVLNSGATLSGFSGLDATGLTVSGATFDASNYSPLTIGTSGLILSSGTFTAPSGTMTISGNFTVSGGTFNHNNGTVLLDGSTTTTLDCTVNDLSNVNLNKTSSGTLILPTDCTFLGNFTRTAGVVSNPGSSRTLSVHGDLSISSNNSFGGSNLTVALSGSGTQTISNTGGATFSSTLRVNKDSGQANLGGTFTVTTVGCAIDKGTLNLAGFNFSCDSGLTVEDEGNLKLNGGETVTTPILNSGSTVIYAATSGTHAIKNWNYHNLTFNGSGGTFTSPATLSITGNLTRTAGTFSHNNGTVNLSGTNQTISGAFTFYNLTKTVSSADTLTFPASARQTIVNTLTLTGTSGNLLSLRSSSTDTRWEIDPQGTRTLEYLDVKDSNNVNTTAIEIAGLNITDSGNNTGWLFDSTPPMLSLNSVASPTTDTTPSVTGTATDDFGTVSSVQFQMNSTSGSWSACTASDGSFDSTSESFACTPATALSDGIHTMYVRATDSNGNTTAPGSESSVTFTVDTIGPIAPTLDSPADGAYITAKHPTFRFKKTTDVTTSVASYELIIKPATAGQFSLVGTIDHEGSNIDNSEKSIHYDGDFIEVRGKTTATALVEGTHTWQVVARDQAGNTVTSARTLHVDQTAPTISHVTLSTDDLVGTKDGYEITTTQTPTITGTLSDNILPDKVEVAYYKQHFFFGSETDRTLTDTKILTLDNPSREKSLTFALSSPGLDLGKYIIELKGIDKAGNKSAATILSLQILNDHQARQLLRDDPVADEKIREKPTVSLPELEKTAKVRRELEAEELKSFTTPIGALWQQITAGSSQLFAAIVETTRGIGRQIIALSQGAGAYASQAYNRLPGALAQGLQVTIIRPTSTVNRLANATHERLGKTEKEVAGRVALSYESANGQLARVGKAWHLAMLSLQKPADDAAGYVTRTKIWFLTFHAVVIDPNATRIENVYIEEIGRDYVVISWETNHYTKNNKINYGKNLMYGRSAFTDDYTKRHVVRLEDLEPGTQYFFEVMSQNKNYAYDAFYTVETLEK